MAIPKVAHLVFQVLAVVSGLVVLFFSLIYLFGDSAVSRSFLWFTALLGFFTVVTDGLFLAYGSD